MQLRQQTKLSQEDVKAIIQRYFSESLERLTKQVDGVEDYEEVAEMLAEIPAMANLPEVHNPNLFLERQDFLLPSEPNSSFKIKGLDLRTTPFNKSDIIKHILEHNDISDPKRKSLRMLEQGLERALTELDRLHKLHINESIDIDVQDEWFKTEKTQPQPNIVTVTPKPSELISKIMDAHMADVQIADKTRMKRRTAFRTFIDCMGDMEIQQIDKKLANKFANTLKQIPSNWMKKFPDSTLKEVLDMSLDGDLAVKTRNDYLSQMTTLLHWAISRGEYEGSNPFIGLKTKENRNLKDSREVFSPHQLEVLFSSPIYTGCSRSKYRTTKGETLILDSMYWIPLVGLFTGARLQEICQLRGKDVRKVEGMWCIDINDNDSDKKLKNRSSERIVPVHQKLIDFGFIKHASKAEDEERIFSDLPLSADDTYSSNFSERFRYVLKQLDIKTEKTSFNSFRHGFMDALRNVDTADSVLKMVVGHKDKSVTANYGSSKQLNRIKTYINKTSFPINWKHLKDAQEKFLSQN